MEEEGYNKRILINLKNFKIINIFLFYFILFYFVLIVIFCEFFNYNGGGRK